MSPVKPAASTRKRDTMALTFLLSLGMGFRVGFRVYAFRGFAACGSYILMGINGSSLRCMNPTLKQGLWFTYTLMGTTVV